MENTMRTQQNQQQRDRYPVSLMVALCTMLATAVILLLTFALPAGAAQTDTQIESTAKQSYVFKTYLKDDDVTIRSNNGVVTLTGTVSEESYKTLAQETVASLPGVKSVDNELEIQGEAPAVSSDAWLMTKVKTSLMFHRNVSGTKTEVLAENGIVTLRGEATSLAQKDLTTEYARDVDGVKDVKNEMTVQKTPPEPSEKTMGAKIDAIGGIIDDASITALVKMTLMSHRSTSGLGTKVETSDGTVTLSGTTKNAAEKALATKFASDVHGVKNVKNRMIME